MSIRIAKVFLPVITLATFVGLGGAVYHNFLNESEKNRALTQQQIDLQREQLSLEKQRLIEATATPEVKTASVIQATPTAKSTPTCDTVRQARQRKFVQAMIYKDQERKAGAENALEVNKAKLLNPNLTETERNTIEKAIESASWGVSDAVTNISNSQKSLDSINACILFVDKSISQWGDLYGITF